MIPYVKNELPDIDELVIVFYKDGEGENFALGYGIGLWNGCRWIRPSIHQGKTEFYTLKYVMGWERIEPKTK